MSTAARFGLAAALSIAGCVAPRPYDYEPYLAHMPRSILVLPPLDETPEVDACYGYLATVTRPLAERGYYVFPVAVVDRMMRENGLPTAGEMHQVSLSKLREIFDCDAVLFLDVKRWGTSYVVLSSNTTVGVEGRLVDARTGTVLWHGAGSVTKRSGDAGNGIAGMLISAIVTQVVDSAFDPSPDVARATNVQLFDDPHDGLLLGPYHPEFANDQAARRQANAQQKAEGGAEAAK